MDTVPSPHPAQCTAKPTTPNSRPRLNNITNAPYTNESHKHTIPDLPNRDVPCCAPQDGTEDAYGKVKVKVKVKVNFTLEQATKVQRGRSIALLFL